MTTKRSAAKEGPGNGSKDGEPTATAATRPRGQDRGASPGNDQSLAAMLGEQGPGDDDGSFMILNGQHIALKRDATDFSVLTPTPASRNVVLELAPDALPMGRNLLRASAPDAASRDALMDEVREHAVAHHIYRKADTDEELVIGEELVVTLRNEGTGQLEALQQQFGLQYVARMGDGHVLRVTEATGANAVRTANRIAQQPGVASASPLLMVDLQFHEAPALLSEQWYLSAELVDAVDVKPDAGIRAPEAWALTKGSPDIVVAVIDDGFDLTHPAFRGAKVHPKARDFEGADDAPAAEGRNYHGTPVASIALGSHGPVMHGIAPGCTFLPLRIGFGRLARQVEIKEVFEHASRYADVVNCSFGFPPTSYDHLSPQLRQTLTRLSHDGGRRGKGLVIVFSAGNDDAPTFLSAADNRNGVLFSRTNALGVGEIGEIPAGQTVYSGYPMTEGVIVVGAMSSLKRKSGYSCWGPHVTVSAPSNNGHYIRDFVAASADPRRKVFDVAYRGHGQVAAVNRQGFGRAYNPLADIDDLATGLDETQYTRTFGGTSGAAPVVSGVVALMLSVNPQLTAAQVKRILASTADTNLDANLDCAQDPNVQGLTGAFTNGVSPFFGAGKVDALRAVQSAKALAVGTSAPAGLTAVSATAIDPVEPPTPTFNPNEVGDPPTASAPVGIYQAILKHGGSLVVRGDLPPQVLRQLAAQAAQTGASLTVRGPNYPAAWLKQIAAAGAGRVSFDFA